MLVKCIIKVFLYLILAVMTLIHWLLKIPMILGNILLYFWEYPKVCVNLQTDVR